MPSVERNTNMSQRSDFPSSDSFREADAAERHPDDQMGAEDPLVQLARIVNRNRPAAASSGGDDYFAALDQDDLLGGSAIPPAEGSGYRVEPQGLSQSQAYSRTGAYDEGLGLRGSAASGQTDDDYYSGAGSEAYAAAPAYEPYAAESYQAAGAYESGTYQPGTSQDDGGYGTAYAGDTLGAAYDEEHEPEAGYSSPRQPLMQDFHLDNRYGSPRSEESGYPETVNQPFVTPDASPQGDPYRYEEQDVQGQGDDTGYGYAPRPAAGLVLDEDAFASSLAAAVEDDYSGQSYPLEPETAAPSGLRLSLDPQELAGYAYDDASMDGDEIYPESGHADGNHEAWPYAGEDHEAARDPERVESGLRGTLNPSPSFDFAASLERGLEDELTGSFGKDEDSGASESSGISGSGSGAMAPALSAALAGSLASALGSGETGESAQQSPEPRVFKPRATPQLPQQPRSVPEASAAPAPEIEGFDAEALASVKQPGRAAAAAVPFVLDSAQPWPALVPDAAVRSAKEASASFAELDDLVGSLFQDEMLQKRPGTERGQPPLDGSELDDMAWPDALRNLPREPAATDEDTPDDEIADIFAQSRMQAQQLPLLYDEDEAPPPPGGYDLDAVARAMQESDPTLAGSGILPPHSEYEERAAPQGGNSRRGLKIAAVVLGVAVLGGAGFAFLGAGGSSAPDGPPPVIAGLEEPLKTYPEAEAEGQGQPAKLIYDRVGGTPADGERMVVQDSPEPAQLPPAPVNDAGNNVMPNGPKKVRTLVVRPDGTVITTPAGSDPAGAAGVRTIAQAPAGQSATLQTPGLPAAGGVLAPATITPLQTVPGIATSGTPVAAQDAAAAPAVPPASPQEQQAAEAIYKGASPRVKPAPGTQVAALQAQPAAAQPVPAQPVPAQPSAPQPVSSGPLNLTQQAPVQQVQQAAVPAASSIAPGTYVVQVTSQRTQEQAQAAYNSLQRKYPSVLGGQTPVIEPIEIEGRGTFYRVRIPAGSRDAADALCGNLQSAGGDCFVRRN
jgi:hypothetical protein